MIIRSMKESSNLNEKFVASDYTKFYDKFYNDFDRVDFDRYLKKYYSTMELVNKNNKSIPTDQLALKAYELGKLGYFKMLKSPNEDKEFKDLLKDFKGRDDKPSWLSDSDMTRNWKDGLKDGKNNSPYIFEYVNESNSSKVVRADDYNNELRKLRSQAKNSSRIEVEEIYPTDFYSTDDGLGIKIKLGVNWSAIGTVDVDEAENFSKDLQKVISLIRNFKYNGYAVTWKK